LIIWLIFFLYLQTKPSFCCLFAWTFLSFLLQSLSVYQFIYFLGFKVAERGSFLSDIFFKSFSEYCKYVYFNIHDSNLFSDIGRDCLLGNRKKIAKFLMRTFTCRSIPSSVDTVFCFLNVLLKIGQG
jgi:hypothetical protein